MIRVGKQQPIYQLGSLCEWHRDLENNKAGCTKNGKRYGEKFHCERHTKKLGLK